MPSVNSFSRAFFGLAMCLLFAGIAVRGAELLSVTASGTNSGNTGVGEALCISADGRFVAFNSGSTNLVVPTATVSSA
jgi:hypothetical protein